MLLRDKPTLRELNIHPEILKECKEMMTNPKYSLHYKKGAIKLLLGVSPCVCGAIPTKEIRYPVEDAGEYPDHTCRVFLSKLL